MKKISLVFSFILATISWVSLSSSHYASGPPLGKTGAPGEGTCADCHGGGAQTGTVSITGIPSTVTPGQVYPIILTSNSATASKGGFELVALSSGSGAGTLTSGAGNTVTNSGSALYVYQTSAKNYSGGSVSWTFNWTAPASLTNNNITFYYSSLLANGNGGSNGDNTIIGSTPTVLTSGATPVTASVSAQTNVTCNGGSNGSATISASGGSGAFSYAWSNGQTSQTATNLTAGAYTCVVTSGTSGTTVNVSITQPTVITGNVMAGTITCASAAAACSVSGAGGNGGFTYTWSNGQTGATATYFAAGTASVIIKDNTNCSITKTFTVNSTANPPTVMVNASPISCTQATSNVSANASGGSGTYTSYMWSNGTTGQSTTYSNSGTASVVITDNAGCSTTQSFSVQNNTVTPNATFSAGTITCSQTSATVTASPSGGNSPYSVTWSNGTTGLSTTYNTSGNYSATITEGSGCSAVKQFSVASNLAAPTASIAVPPVFCAGNTVQLNATTSGSVLYVWNATNGGNITSGSNSATPSVNSAGSYAVIVTNTSNGCTATASTNVQQGVAPTLAMSSSNTINCTTTNSTLSAVNIATGNTFSWKNANGFSSTLSNPSITSGGTYNVTVTKSGGCTSIGSITVTEDKAVPVATATTSNISCANNQKATLVASGGVSYAWLGTGFTSNKKDTSTLNSGTYSVTVTAANGCKNSASVVVSQNTTAPNITASAGQLSCANPKATLTGSSTTPNATYTWTGPNNFSATKKDTSTSVSGTYILNIKNPLNSCESSQTVTIAQNSQLPQVSTVNDTISCKKTTATIGATSSTAGVTYAWKGPNNTTFTTAQIPNAAVGAYQVTVTATNGCTVVSSANVVSNKVAPTASISPKSVKICDGKTAIFTSTTTCTCTATLVWKNEAGATLATSPTWTQASTSGQKLFLEATNTSSGCVSKDTANFSVVSLPTATVTTKIKDCNVICATGTATNGTAPYTYKYSSGDATGCNLSTGANTVSVTDANGCATISNFNVTLPQQLLAIATTKVKDCNVVCATAAATGGTAPYTYKYSSGDATGCNLKAGANSISVTDANACLNVVTFTAIVPMPLAATVGKITNAVKGQTNGGATIVTTGGGGTTSFVWSDANGKQVSTTQNLTNVGAGVYTCNIADTNGCKTSINVTIGETVATQNVDLERFIQLFPNPANDNFTIKITANTTNARLTILSMEGREILRQTLENDNVIDVSQFARGMYLVKININNEAVYKRVILN